MKKILVYVLAVVCFAAGPMYAAEMGGTRFYGKITTVDPAGKSLTVHNARQNADTTFVLDNQSQLVSNKKPITPQELKSGQSVVVSYRSENNVNRATKVVVRTPFKKAS